MGYFRGKYTSLMQMRNLLLATRYDMKFKKKWMHFEGWFLQLEEENGQLW